MPTPEKNHIHIRFKTRLLDLKAAANRAKKDIEILDELIRCTYEDMEHDGRIKERTYTELSMA